MLDHIATISELEAEAKQIDDFLNEPCGEQMNECCVRGDQTIVYMARTGKMLADAKFWKDKAIKTALLSQDQSRLSPSIHKMLIDSMNERENYLVNWIERLNKACYHQIEWLRTMISKEKEFVKLEGRMNG